MKTIKLNLPTLVLTLIELAVGILLIINPIGFTSAIIRAIGIGLAVGGVIWCIKYFRTQVLEAAASGMLFAGIVCFLLGIFLITKTKWLITTFTVLLGIYAVMILLLGVLKLQWTIDLIRMKREKWGISLVSALVAIVAALLILWNPFKTAELIWKLAGAALLAQVVLDFAGLLFSPRVIEQPAKPQSEKKSSEQEQQTDPEQ